MRVRDKQWIRIRIYSVGAAFMLGFGLIAARAYQIQVLEGDRLRALAQEGYTGTLDLPRKRGSIYDRSGHVLASNLEARSVFLRPLQIRDRSRTASLLAKALGQKTRAIRQLTESSKGFVWLARQIPSETARRIEVLNLEGVGVVAESRRFYPGGELGAHVLGFAGTDNVGLEGLEKMYDAELSGEAGRIVQMRDALSRAFRVITPQGPHTIPHDLVLTLDKDIQYKAQEALRHAVAKARAKAGQCLVMDPHTGAILAMAVVPEFNPNRIQRYSPDQWRNRIITDCFEPGSALKAFLVAAGLEEGVITPDTTFYCENGAFRVGSHTIHDTHAYGTLRVAEILHVSSNIGAVKIGEKLGYGTFTRYLKRFGFGAPTGIDLLGERSGFIRDEKETRLIDRATLCFGQGMSVTLLQLVTAMAAIANGGRLMKPYVVKEIRKSDGSTVRQVLPRTIRQVLSPKVARLTAQLLAGVVQEGGTATAAAIPGYTVAGKTGTSQKVDPETGTYSREKYTALFVGFSPLKNPRMVIGVVLDEPKGVIYGGPTAGPVFREVGLWALHHLGIPPMTQMAESPPTPLQPLAPATRRAKETGFRLEAVRRLAQSLQAGHMPDFRGLGIREVLLKAQELGLTVRIEGTGLAVMQNPDPGNPLREGQTLLVRFSPPH